MKRFPILTGCLLVVMANFVNAAGTISGQLEVKIVITGACSITNGNASGSSNEFGTLDFGTHADLSATVDAQAFGTGGNAVGVNCSPALPYTVEVNNGVHASSGQRRMQNQTASLNTNYINYNLYQDAARSTAWVSGTTLALTGTGANQPLGIYGRVPTDTAPAIGTYTDSVTVTITW